MKVFAGLAVLLFLVGASLGADYQTLAEPPECPEAIPGVVLNITFYPNEDDCSKYWECDNGNLYNGSCTDGLVWNPNVDSCDWPYNYDCPYDKMGPSLLPSQDIDCPVPPPGEVYNITFYPDETDCTKYWECDNGNLYNGSCPDGLLWNPNVDSCDWDYNYDCPYDKAGPSLMPSQVIDCPQPSPGEQSNVTFYPDEEDCSRYWECVNGNLLNLTCPGDLVWNPNIDTCDWPYNYQCPYDKGQSVSQVVEFACPRTRPGVVMYFADKNDIQKYWECLNGEATERNCQLDMVFDPNLRKCVFEFS